MTVQGQTRTKSGGGASPAQKAALAKARAARSAQSAGGAGGMNIGSSLVHLNQQFENIQQLEKLTQQFWKDARPYIGAQVSSPMSRTRGAQQTKGRKGSQVTGQSGQATTG